MRPSGEPRNHPGVAFCPEIGQWTGSRLDTIVRPTGAQKQAGAEHELSAVF